MLSSLMIGYGHALWSATDKLNSLALGETPDIPKAIRDASLAAMRPEIIQNAVLESIVIAMAFYVFIVWIAFWVNKKYNASQ